MQQLAAPLKFLSLEKYQLMVASPLWLSMLSLLNCFGIVEVTGSTANHEKAWHETFGVEDA